VTTAVSFEKELYTLIRN